MLKKVATSLVFAVGLMVGAPAPASAECSKDNYGGCGEVPPETDRGRPAPAEPAPTPAPAPAQPSIRRWVPSMRHAG